MTLKTPNYAISFEGNCFVVQANRKAYRNKIERLGYGYVASQIERKLGLDGKKVATEILEVYLENRKREFKNQQKEMEKE